MKRNGWGDFFFFFLAAFLEQGVRRSSGSSMSGPGGGWCDEEGLRGRGPGWEVETKAFVT